MEPEWQTVKMDNKKIINQLKKAMRTKCLIRLKRRFEDCFIRGYVTDIGAEFFILALVSDRCWYDGFECFRIRDIKSVAIDPYRTFTESALRKRNALRNKKPNIDLASIENLLLTANKKFNLVTIHREKVKPEACWIGRVLEIKKQRVSILEIGPNAKWDKSPEKHRINEITRVNFGGDYENALYLVGGEPHKT